MTPEAKKKRDEIIYYIMPPEFLNELGEELAIKHIAAARYIYTSGYQIAKDEEFKREEAEPKVTGMWCEICKQDHHIKGNVRWCDRSDLEIRFDAASKYIKKLEAENSEWKKYKGISELIKAKDKIMNSYIVSDNGCWEWTGIISKHGYGQFHFGDCAANAHRVSYMVFKGPIKEKLLVCHSCDNRKCVNPDHLWLGTTKDNAQDCVKKGRMWLQQDTPETRVFKENFKKHIKCGELHNRAKLTVEQVLFIREQYRTRYTRNLCSELASMFNVSNAAIRNCANGKNWKNLIKKDKTARAALKADEEAGE